jgi:predicted butyrate kinase (DUF1464 family)
MLLNQLADEHVKFGDELKHLLTAQVVLTERVDKNAIAIAELIEAQKHTDQRLNALITVVDGLIRTPPQAPPQ